LRLNRFDHIDRRLFLLDQHSSDLNAVKRYVEQDEFRFGSRGAPCLRTSAENHKKSVVLPGIQTAHSGGFADIAEAEKGVVRVLYLILELKRIRQRIFALGDHDQVFNTVAIQVRSHHWGGRFFRERKRGSKLLLHKRNERLQLCLVRSGSSLSHRNQGCSKNQNSAQILHKQSLTCFSGFSRSIQAFHPSG